MKKFIRFYMNVWGWMALCYLPYAIFIWATTGNTTLFDDWLISLIMAPLWLYASTTFRDDLYTPYKWNIVGRFFKCIMTEVYS